MLLSSTANVYTVHLADILNLHLFSKLDTLIFENESTKQNGQQ